MPAFGSPRWPFAIHGMDQHRQRSSLFSKNFYIKKFEMQAQAIPKTLAAMTYHWSASGHVGLPQKKCGNPKAGRWCLLLVRWPFAIPGVDQYWTALCRLRTSNFCFWNAMMIENSKKRGAYIAPIRFWIPWIFACHGTEPSVGRSGDGMDCSEEMGSSAPFKGYGYVARMTPIKMIWGIKRRIRGKKPLNCQPRNQGYNGWNIQINE